MIRVRGILNEGHVWAKALEIYSFLIESLSKIWNQGRQKYINFEVYRNKDVMATAFFNSKKKIRCEKIIPIWDFPLDWQFDILFI